MTCNSGHEPTTKGMGSPADLLATAEGWLEREGARPPLQRAGRTRGDSLEGHSYRNNIEQFCNQSSKARG